MQGRIPVVVRTIVFSHIIESTNTNLGYTVTDTVCFLTRISSRSRFIIIVYNIYILIFGSVTALSCPVIEYIIPDIDILIKLCAGARATRRHGFRNVLSSYGDRKLCFHPSFLRSNVYPCHEPIHEVPEPRCTTAR